MEYNFRWLDEDDVLEGKLKTSQGFFDSSGVYQEITKKMKERGLRKIHLLLDISELELSDVNATLLSTLLLPLFIDNALGWGVLYGVDTTIMKILGTNVTFSLGMRLKTAPDREDALLLLARKGVLKQPG